MCARRSGNERLWCAAVSYRLYDYWRSSAAYRVRIALNLKGVSCVQVPVHLARDGGEQHRPDYLDVNPQKLVPVLEADGRRITQSLAIIQYLDERHPEPPLLPADDSGRARVRALALAVACDMHPLMNLRVLKYLTGPMRLDEGQKMTWYRHWMAEGLTAIERLLADSADTGEYCHGDRPGLADLCLVPQLYNARRFNCDLDPYPTVRRIENACLELAAFDAALPENQPDAVR